MPGPRKKYYFSTPNLSHTPLSGSLQMVITTVYKLIWCLAGQGLEMNTGGVISADLSAASRALLVPGNGSDIRLIPSDSQKEFLPTSWTPEGCGKGIEQEKHSCGSGFSHAHPR